MSEPTLDEHASLIAKINRRRNIVLTAAIAIIIGGGAPFDRIFFFIGSALSVALILVLLCEVICRFCSPISKARTRFGTAIVFALMCATFPLNELARLASEKAVSENLVGAYDRATGRDDGRVPQSAPTSPMSEDELLVAFMDAVSTRSSTRQARYLNTLSMLDLDTAITASQLNSADGRADALGRLAQFDQATAEFMSSQDEDINWAEAQLAAWSVAPNLSAQLIAGLKSGKDKAAPTLKRWLDIQHERSYVMKEVVAAKAKGLQDDSERILRERLSTLAAEEQGLGQAQAANNEETREQLSR